MDKQEILEEIQKGFRAILDDENVVISETSDANNVKGWDSLVHISIVAHIEGSLGVKLTTKEILQFHTVGDLITILQSKK
jgi:acyl carrier protein